MANHPRLVPKIDVKYCALVGRKEHRLYKKLTGCPFKVPVQVLLEAVAAGHVRFPSKGWDTVCRQVAVEFDLTRVCVRLNTETIRWAN